MGYSLCFQQASRRRQTILFVSVSPLLQANVHHARGLAEMWFFFFIGALELISCWRSQGQLRCEQGHAEKEPGSTALMQILHLSSRIQILDFSFCVCVCVFGKAKCISPAFSIPPAVISYISLLIKCSFSEQRMFISTGCCRCGGKAPGGQHVVRATCYLMLWAGRWCAQRQNSSSTLHLQYSRSSSYCSGTILPCWHCRSNDKNIIHYQNSLLLYHAVSPQ